MGANSVTRTYDGKLSAQELKREFAADQDQCRFENGSSYSGEIGMLQGLVIEAQTFPSVDEAASYILDKAEKWGAGIAVKARNIRTERIGLPTFGGERPARRSGGLSYLVKEGSVWTGSACIDQLPVCVPADQLSPTERDRLRKLFREAQSIKDALREEERSFNALLSVLRDTDQPCPPLAKLKAVRARLAKLKRLEPKASAKLKALDSKLEEKLYEKRTVDDGDVWVVGGWASS